MELTARRPRNRDSSCHQHSKHMNDKQINIPKNPNDLSDIEKLKLDFVRHTIINDSCIARINALERMLEELAVFVFGNTPSLATFMERKEQHYKDTLKEQREYVDRKKPNQN